MATAGRAFSKGRTIKQNGNPARAGLPFCLGGAVMAFRVFALFQCRDTAGTRFPTCAGRCCFQPVPTVDTIFYPAPRLWLPSSPVHYGDSSRSHMSIQTLGRYGIVLFLAALSSGCSSIIGECGLARSSCMYEGKYEQGEEDYAEAEAKRLNKQSTDRLRRSSGD